MIYLGWVWVAWSLRLASCIRNKLAECEGSEPRSYIHTLPTMLPVQVISGPALGRRCRNADLKGRKGPQLLLTIIYILRQPDG